jgi:ribosomal protein S6
LIIATPVFLIAHPPPLAVSIVALSILDFGSLTALMKQVSMKIVENGGIVRSIQNHGVREFPHRVKAKYPDFRTGQRYYDQGRYISVYYDSNPVTQKNVEIILQRSEDVLRMSTLRARSKLDYITMEREGKNPIVQQVLQEERNMKWNEQQQQQEEGEEETDKLV